jgi:transcription antitermination factor NusA-like protein
VAEVGGEKIDIIPWADDPAVFVANALSPAQVLSVDIDEEHRIASVTVPERMLSLAIGREGQNARLAARLTGWRIDIRSDVAQAETGRDGHEPRAGKDVPEPTAGPASGSASPAPEVAESAPEAPATEPAPVKPKRASRAKTATAEVPAEPAAGVPAAVAAEAAPDEGVSS